MGTVAALAGGRLGDFEVIRYLATGGMADLYLVHSPRYRDRLVLKRVQARFLGNEKILDMFRDEGQIGALLDHPNIVRVFEVGEAAGHPHIAMEYIAGHDLVEVLRACTARRMVFPPHLGAAICAQLARGLAFAHDLRDPQGRRLDIVHCDISPGNIMVSWRGTVKLVDFGVAQARIPLHCQERGVAGKYNYMAPEQIRGEAVDRRADLFSLGVILYEVTCGRRLFKGRPEEVMRRVVEEPIPPPRSLDPDYPPELEAVVMRALARDPAARYATAEALRVDLVAVLARTRRSAGKHELAEFLRRVYEGKDDPDGAGELDAEVARGGVPSGEADADAEGDDEANETVELHSSQRSPHLRILDLSDDDFTKEADLSALMRYSEREEGMMTRTDNPLLLRGVPLPKLARDPEQTGLLVPPEVRRRRHSGGFTTHMLGEGRTAQVYARPQSPGAGQDVTPLSGQDMPLLLLDDIDDDSLDARPAYGDNGHGGPGHGDNGHGDNGAPRDPADPRDDLDARPPGGGAPGPRRTAPASAPGTDAHTALVVLRGRPGRGQTSLNGAPRLGAQVAPAPQAAAAPSADSARRWRLTEADRRLIGWAFAIAVLVLLCAYFLAQQ